MSARWVSWVGFLTFILVGCGKSRGDRAPTGGAFTNGGEGGGTAGSNAGGRSGANSGAGDAGSVVVIAGGASSDGGAQTGGASGGAAQPGGGAGGDTAVVCDGHEGFVTVSGGLPTEFGSSTTLGGGCSNIAVDEHGFPVNYSRRKPDSGGIDHTVFACGTDGSSSIELKLAYPSATGEPSGAVIFSFDGAVLHAPALSSFAATERPLEHWPYPENEADGLGKVFSGTFEAPGAGNRGTITGSFSVCHVANLPAPGT